MLHEGEERAPRKLKPRLSWGILLRGAAGLVGKRTAVGGQFLWATDAEQTDLWVLAFTVTPNCL